MANWAIDLPEGTIMLTGSMANQLGFCLACKGDRLTTHIMSVVARQASEDYYGPVAYEIGLELGYIQRERSGEK